MFQNVFLRTGFIILISMHSQAQGSESQIRCDSQPRAYGVRGSYSTDVDLLNLGISQRVFSEHRCDDRRGASARCEELLVQAPMNLQVRAQIERILTDVEAAAVNRCQTNASLAIVAGQGESLQNLVNSKPVCPPGVSPVIPDTREEPCPWGRPEVLDGTFCALSSDAACTVTESDAYADMVLASGRVLTNNRGQCWITCEFKLQGVHAKAKAEGKACYVARPACIL